MFVLVFFVWVLNRRIYVVISVWFIKISRLIEEILLLLKRKKNGTDDTKEEADESTRGGQEKKQGTIRLCLLRFQISDSPLISFGFQYLT